MALDGQTLNIKGLTANSSNIGQPLRADGASKLIIVKL